MPHAAPFKIRKRDVEHVPILVMALDAAVMGRREHAQFGDVLRKQLATALSCVDHRDTLDAGGAA